MRRSKSGPTAEQPTHPVRPCRQGRRLRLVVRPAGEQQQWDAGRLRVRTEAAGDVQAVNAWDQQIDQNQGRRVGEGRAQPLAAVRRRRQSHSRRRGGHRPSSPKRSGSCSRIRTRVAVMGQRADPAGARYDAGRNEEAVPREEGVWGNNVGPRPEPGKRGAGADIPRQTRKVAGGDGRDRRQRYTAGEKRRPGRSAGGQDGRPSGAVPTANACRSRSASAADGVSGRVQTGPGRVCRRCLSICTTHGPPRTTQPTVMGADSGSCSGGFDGGAVSLGGRNACNMGGLSQARYLAGLRRKRRQGRNRESYRRVMRKR